MLSEDLRVFDSIDVPEIVAVLTLVQLMPI